MKIYYSSDEMFSSTDLIRKSKPIFDSLNSKEIDKAVILRDGKPSFILIDFASYEAMMKDYMLLKEQSLLPTKQSSKEKVSEKQDENEEEIKSKVENLEFKIQSDEHTKAPLKEFWDE